MHRMERVNSEVMKALLQIVQNMNDKRISGKLISFSYVNTAPDLKSARVGVYGGKENLELVKALNNCKGFIRRELASKMNIKSTPDLTFVLDETEAKADRIEELLKQIRN